MANFPPRYVVSWPFRLVWPSLRGGEGLDRAPLRAKIDDGAGKPAARIVVLGDLGATPNARPLACDPTLRELIASADLVVANCEGPVMRRPRNLATRSGLRHAIEPDHLAGLLAALGVETERLVLGLANNHILDQGTVGLAETLAHLKAMGVRSVGAGMAGPVPTLTVSAGLVDITLVAFTRWRNGGDAAYRRHVALQDALEPDDWRVVREEAARGGLTCVLPHWDWEFRHFPRPQTRRLARELAGKGATLIVGSHPHVLQPLERVDDALIAYGIGDLAGCLHERQPWPTRLSGMLSVDVDRAGRLLGYELTPVVRLRGERSDRLVPVSARSNGASANRVALLFPP